MHYLLNEFTKRAVNWKTKFILITRRIICMTRKNIQRLLCLVIAIVFALSISACGQKAEPAKSEEPQKAAEEPKKADEPKKAEPVTIKFFTNLPDRSQGQGKLEQTIMDNYVKENPNVKFEIEALQDEPFKQKFKAYAASNSVPDMFTTWGGPAYLQAFAKAGYLAELNKDDYKDYGFFKGSLENFSMGGKLYGLPRNTDLRVIIYNKGLFDKAGVKVPTTIDELKEAAKITLVGCE